MEGFYRRLVSRSEPPAKCTAAELENIKQHWLTLRTEAWSLVTQILADIFQEFAQRRAEGAAAQGDMSSASKTALILYSTLKAHTFMNELREKEFERHPCMSPTFNAFFSLRERECPTFGGLTLRSLNCRLS